MKIRTLRKKSTGEFMEISRISGNDMLFISDLPKSISDHLTIEKFRENYGKYYPTEIDDIEIAEFDLIESNTVGADIRNKLTPPLNLIALIKLYFKENNDPKVQKNLKRLIITEIEKSEENIKYISNLL